MNRGTSSPARPPPAPPPNDGKVTAGSLRLPAKYIDPPEDSGLGVEGSVIGHLMRGGGGDAPRVEGGEDYYTNVVLNEMLLTGNSCSNNNSSNNNSSNEGQVEECVGHTQAKKFLTESTILPLLLPEFFPLQTPTTNVLLYGPPGTGKTMLVKTLIEDLRSDEENSFRVNFFSVNGSAVGNKYRGESEKVLRAVFDCARSYDAGVGEGETLSIVLLDEVDSLFGDGGGGGDESSLRLKTTLLTHLDGVAAGGEGKNKVVVVGTTNLPYSLSEALLRRFNKRVLIDLPEEEDRRVMVENCLKGVRVEGGVDFGAVAKLTEGWSGSDLKVLMRDVAMNPLRRYFARFGSVAEIEAHNRKLVEDGLGGIREEDLGCVTEEDVVRGLQSNNSSCKRGADECRRFQQELGSG